METKMNAIRWKSIDYIKGIACIAVVFIHYNFPGDLGTAVKAFSRLGVPTFFMVSGFFFLTNEKMVDEKVVKKIRHIFNLIVFSGLFYAIFAVFENSVSRSTWDITVYIKERMTADRIVKFFITNDPFVYSHLWFLFGLMYCYVISLLLFGNNKRLNCIKLLAPILLIAYSCLQEFGGVLGISRSVPIPGTEQRIYLFNLFIFRALPFFFFGILTRKYSHLVSNFPFTKLSCFVIFVVGGLLAVWERFTFGEAQFFLGTYVMVVAMFILALKNPALDGVLGYIGRELSLHVYILHIAIGRTLDIIANKLGINKLTTYLYTKVFIILALSLTCAYLLNYLKNYTIVIKKKDNI